MSNFVINRSDRGTGQVFARGKKAISIDDRTGFKKRYKDMVFEPGTNYWVHWEESDRDYSLVSHPQNFVNKEKLVDRIALKYAHPDVQFDTDWLFMEDGTSFLLLEDGGNIGIE